MKRPLWELAPRDLCPDDFALFLDFDGTFVDLALHPDDVVVGPRTKRMLKLVFQKLSGAVAIVSGRSIADLDQRLSPVRLPMAGVHGLERRDSAGLLQVAHIDHDAVAGLRAEIHRFAEALPGLHVEDKPGSVTLHYRARPELEGHCHAAMRESADRIGGFSLLRGKMVIEAKVGRANKASAVAAFMAEPPFCGRRPVFAGDDVTDEDAFAEIAGMKGIAIKVGGGATRAAYRAENPNQFRAWLAELSQPSGS